MDSRKILTSVALTLLLALALPRAALAQGAASPGEIPVDSWPRTVTSGGDTLTIYEPQVESWQGNVMQARGDRRGNAPVVPHNATQGVTAMKLKQLALPMMILAVATSVVAAENKKPVAKWTCAEFLAVDDQFKPKVVYAATAYAKGGKPEASVIDIDGTEKVTPMIIDECNKAPQASFWQKLKGAWAKVEADAKAEMKKIEKKM